MKMKKLLPLALAIALVLPSLADDTGPRRRRRGAGEGSCFKDLAGVFSFDEKRLDIALKSQRFQDLYEAMQGLSPAAVERFKQDIRDAFRTSTRSLEGRLYDMQNYIRTYDIARGTANHVVILGPPGGAKSLVIREANRAAESLDDPSSKLILWVKQVHEQTSPMELIGGQTRQGIMEGREDINYEGTMVDHAYIMIDEGEKAPPATLGSLLRVLNEGEIDIQGQTVEADTRTVAFLGNAYKYEIIQRFEEQGQGTSGPAFLNRMVYSMQVPNWLAMEYQIRRERDIAQNRQMRAYAMSNPAIADMLRRSEATPIVDFEFLEAAAYALFDVSESYKENLPHFVNALRQKYHTRIRTRENPQTRGNIDPRFQEFPYVPSAEFSERLRSEVTKTIIVSAFLDFLNSPLANDGSLESLLTRTQDGDFRRFKLTEESLWRAFPIFTMVGPGRTSFDVTENKILWDQILINGEWRDRDYNAIMQNAKDAREEYGLLIQRDEQKDFESTLHNFLKDHNSTPESTDPKLNFEQALVESLQTAE